ncbi:MAG: O-antigen ligase family protein [Sedimentisphaerales bacterium]|nr:O-antigen ligase family protein [Sedimentisphaerales bacterium]
MKKMLYDSSLSKTKVQVILEYALLALCLCVIALRVTFTESPPTQSVTPSNLTDNFYTLSVSAVLFLSFVFWFIYGFCGKRFSYRPTALEFGLCLFCIAAVISALGASNKRAAITDAVCLISPILMAVLLVQILDSHSKIKLVLTVITALGVVSAYQCSEQFFASNQATIDQYEEAPQTVLEPFGIEPGSLQQFLFEHRLYSKDVRGFFTTSNSAGSFAILASLAALALFLDKLRNRQSQTSSSLPLITSGAAVAIIIFGLLLAHSKGAIAASLIAAAMFVVFLYRGNWLKLHKKSLLLICLLLFIIAVCAITAYGLAHDRLPGGNSMLVRWQYWHASAKMYADHPFTGVGPGNFAHFYTHYKPAAAAESVSDPHNFLISVLTQYGPLGLLGFAALLLIPLWKSFPDIAGFSQQLQEQPTFKSLAITYLILISAFLLLIRPLIIPFAAENFSDALIAMSILFVEPVIAFAVGFWLLTARAETNQPRLTYVPVALFCAALGLILHNLIDFAIFEPPVFTALCAVIACLIASDYQQNPRPALAVKPFLPIRITFAAAGLLLVVCFLNYALLPVAKTSVLNRRAVQQQQQFEYAHQLLSQATEQDPLDPTSPALNGRLCLMYYKETPNAPPDLLKKAEVCFLIAIARDKADFKNYERLGDVYALLAKSSQNQEKIDLLNQSLDYLRSAVGFYPASSELRFKLAEVADQLVMTDVAFDNYRQAVEIEDAYRDQFKIMYPGREIFSRLAVKKYEKAKQRIMSLSGQPH